MRIARIQLQNNLRKQIESGAVGARELRRVGGEAANQRAHEQANFDVRKRLCAELIRLSRTTGEGRVVVSPPPTHAEFAARISTHREAITKALSLLEREGMVTRSPSAIVICDIDRLRHTLAADD